jgi:hypothetical protein
MDTNKRKREGWKKAYQDRADANWHNEQAYREIHGNSAETDLIKQVGENAANAHVAHDRLTNAAAQGLHIRAQASKLDVDVADAKVEANWQAVKAGKADNLVVMTAGGAPTNVVDAINRSQDAARDLALAGMRKEAADRVQKTYLSQQLQANTAMVDNQTLQQFAGGIDTEGDHGAQRALANALKQKHSIRSEAVENAASIINDSNLSDLEIGKLARGKTIDGKVTIMTDEIQEAALKMIGSSKNTGALIEFLDKVDTSKLGENQRITLVNALQSNGSKPKFITAGVAANIRLQDNVQNLGKDMMDTHIKAALEANKYPAEVLVSDQDKDVIDRITKSIQKNRSSYSPETLAQLKKNIKAAYDSDILRNKIGDRDRYLKNLSHLIDDENYDITNPDPSDIT